MWLSCSPDDIARLSDRFLADLMVRLLEAEARANGVPTGSIHSGGHHLAPDGGIDVSIEWDGEPASTPRLPRRLVFFQCKAEPMPAGKITTEMRPRGALRQMFAELAARDGAYIICSTESCSRPALKKRCDAMQAALVDAEPSARIHADFLDADALARWVNDHPGVALWVLEKSGRPAGGWRGWGRWSAPDDVGEAPYLLDERLRAQLGDEPRGEPVSAANGLERIRSLLAHPRSVVRLVGLSGMGKTRFAEALFDARVGEGAPSPDLVLYTDMSWEPSARPVDVVERLVAERRDAIVVVDNCPGESHRTLSQIVRHAESKTRLLTIDFDVGDDRPEGTQVVRLDSSSNELIEKLLAHRAPALSFVDRRRVVEYSDGNARIALAIAAAAGQTGSIASLDDRQILKRLFQVDRRPAGELMMRCMEAAALVYSFDTEPRDERPPEADLIAALARTSPEELHRAISEALDLGVMQKRGRWRAVMPHALGVRLARQAFKRIAHKDIVDVLVDEASPRLSLSFFKRIGALHDVEPACALARRMMAPDGPWGDPSKLEGETLAAFLAAAPAAPEDALQAMERTLAGEQLERRVSVDNYGRGCFVRLAGKLAYEPELFDRAARIVAAFAIAEPKNHNNNAALSLFQSMFWIVCSGVNVPPPDRFAALDYLLEGNEEPERELAVNALGAALRTSHFTTTGDAFEFGSRSRDQGWAPRSKADERVWFEAVASRLESIAAHDDETARLARRTMGQQLRGLARLGLDDLVAPSFRDRREKRFDLDLWKSVCETLFFDREELPAAVVDRLDSLEKDLRPTGIGERFEAFVVGTAFDVYPPDGNVEDRGYGWSQRQAYQIGVELARQGEPLTHFLGRTVSAQGGALGTFGRGVANGSADQRLSWKRLREAFAACARDGRNAAVLGGFLGAVHEHDPDLASEWLDQAVDDNELAPHLVHLTCCTELDARALERLIKVAETADEQLVRSFVQLQSGGLTGTVEPDHLAKLLSVLGGKGPQGALVALDVLHMRLFGDRQRVGDVSSALLSVGSNLLRTPDLVPGAHGWHGSGVGAVAKVVLAHGDQTDLAQHLCQRLRVALESREWQTDGYEELARVLAEFAPRVVLNEIIDLELEGGSAYFRFESVFQDYSRDDEGAIGAAGPEALMDWVDEEPTRRAPKLAQLVGCYRAKGEDADFEWTPIALQLIDMEPLVEGVLDALASRLRTGSWSGSAARRHERQRALMTGLLKHTNPVVREWARKTAEEIEVWIVREREWERDDDERFE